MLDHSARNPDHGTRYPPAYSVGRKYEGKDIHGDWRLITLTSENADGTFQAVVHDGFNTLWRQVHPANLRYQRATRGLLPIPNTKNHYSENGRNRYQYAPPRAQNGHGVRTPSTCPSSVPRSDEYENFAGTGYASPSPYYGYHYGFGTNKKMQNGDVVNADKSAETQYYNTTQFTAHFTTTTTTMQQERYVQNDYATPYQHGYNPQQNGQYNFRPQQPQETQLPFQYNPDWTGVLCPVAPVNEQNAQPQMWIGNNTQNPYPQNTAPPQPFLSQCPNVPIYNIQQSSQLDGIESQHCPTIGMKNPQSPKDISQQLQTSHSVNATNGFVQPLTMVNDAHQQPQSIDCLSIPPTPTDQGQFYLESSQFKNDKSNFASTGSPHAHRKTPKNQSLAFVPAPLSPNGRFSSSFQNAGSPTRSPSSKRGHPISANQSIPNTPKSSVTHHSLHSHGFFAHHEQRSPQSAAPYHILPPHVPTTPSGNICERFAHPLSPTRLHCEETYPRPKPFPNFEDQQSVHTEEEADQEELRSVSGDIEVEGGSIVLQTMHGLVVCVPSDPALPPEEEVVQLEEEQEEECAEELPLWEAPEKSATRTSKKSKTPSKHDAYDDLCSYENDNISYGRTTKYQNSSDCYNTSSYGGYGTRKKTQQRSSESRGYYYEDADEEYYSSKNSKFHGFSDYRDNITTTYGANKYRHPHSAHYVSLRPSKNAYQKATWHQKSEPKWEEETVPYSPIHNRKENVAKTSSPADMRQLSWRKVIKKEENNQDNLSTTIASGITEDFTSGSGGSNGGDHREEKEHSSMKAREPSVFSSKVSNSEGKVVKRYHMVRHSHPLLNTYAQDPKNVIITWQRLSAKDRKKCLENLIEISLSTDDSEDGNAILLVFSAILKHGVKKQWLKHLLRMLHAAPAGVRKSLWRKLIQLLEEF